MASNSSQESSGTTEVERKYCKKCNIRMSSVVFDNHSLCISCRGTDCNFHNQCDVCKEWAPEQMELYVKHRRTLASKNRSKKDKRDKGEEVKKDELSSSGLKPQSLGDGNESNVTQGITEDRVVKLISDSLAEFDGHGEIHSACCFFWDLLEGQKERLHFVPLPSSCG